jgi:hypothetical protein
VGTGLIYVDQIKHFKVLIEETGIPYQKLVNLCLRKGAQIGRRCTC